MNDETESLNKIIDIGWSGEEMLPRTADHEKQLSFEKDAAKIRHYTETLRGEIGAVLPITYMKHIKRMIKLHGTHRTLKAIEAEIARVEQMEIKEVQADAETTYSYLITLSDVYTQQAELYNEALSQPPKKDD